MRSSVAIAGTFVVVAALAHLSHRHLNSIDNSGRPADLHETLPSEEALVLMSLTYESLVADYYWLKTINEFGDIQKHRARYPNLIALNRRVLALDPYFQTAYRFAGTALTIQGFDPRISVEILEKGRRFRPDLWEIPFFLGFNRYYFLGDFPGAAEAMAEAARKPGAPALVGRLATRLAAEAHRPEIGIEMIDSILDTLHDERTRAIYLKRRDILLVELHLLWLNQAVDEYRKMTDTCPTSIAELVAAGILRGVPKEPLGGSYRIESCRAVTTSEYEPLRVYGKTGKTR